MIIKLIPKTHKGKNVINKWGDRWKIFESTPHSFLLFSTKEDTSISKTYLPDSSRWVEIKNDKDFEIEME